MVLAVLALASASAPPPIGGGTPTADWPAVVAVVASSASNGYDIFCSGTLIAPRAVLTCAHCAIRMQEYLDGGDQAYVVFGGDVWDGKTGFAAVSALRWNEAYLDAADAWEACDAGSDIGLLWLDEPVTGVAPIEVNAEPVTDAWVGLELDYVGYGRTRKDTEDAGTKRHAAMPVSAVAEMWIENDGSASGQNVCSADSGSAALRTFDDGVTRLVGVPAGLFWTVGEEPCEEGYGRSIRADTQLARVASWTAELEAAEEVTLGDSAADPAPSMDEATGCGCATRRAPAGWGLLGCFAALSLGRLRPC